MLSATCAWHDRWSPCMLCHHSPQSACMHDCMHACTNTTIYSPHMQDYIYLTLVFPMPSQFKYRLLWKVNACPSILDCLRWLTQSLSGSLVGRVRRMREAYRVVRCTLRVTTCSCCPWSPHWRAEWTVAQSPQTAKCQGSLHQYIVLSAPWQVRC